MTATTDLGLRRIAKEAVTFQGTAWSMQKERELALLLEFLDRQQVRRVLEIGSNYGGTTWALSHLDLERLVCIDLQVLDGRMEQAQNVRHDLVIGDSTSHDTRLQVEELMGGNSFDFVFIDGDHRYESVWADWINWAPLVRPAGFVAFHDICHRRIDGINMWRLWTEVRDGLPYCEIYDPSEAWGGIGIIQKPPITQWRESIFSSLAWFGGFVPPNHCLT